MDETNNIDDNKEEKPEDSVVLEETAPKDSVEEPVENKDEFSDKKKDNINIDKDTPQDSEKIEEGIIVKDIDSNEGFNNKLKRFFKKKRNIVILSILGVILLIALSVFLLRHQIFKSSIVGKVNGSSATITNETVFVDGVAVSVGSDGGFKLSSINYGKHSILIKANGYQDFKESVNLSIGENDLVFQLVQLKYGNLKGSLSSSVANDTHIQALQVMLGNNKATVDASGNFSYSNIPVGNYSLSITSPFYKSVSQNITLNPGDATLPVITLTPAGEIKGVVKDWLTQKTMSNVNIVINSNSYQTDSSGNYDITNLPTGQVQLSLSANNYNTQQPTIAVVQGVNSVNEYDLVPDGLITYVSSIAGNNNIYLANYDGTNAIQISNNSTDFADSMISSDGNAVYYLKQKDSGTVQLLAYNISNKSTSLEIDNIPLDNTAVTINGIIDIKLQAFLAVLNNPDGSMALNYEKSNGSTVKTLDTIPSGNYIGSYIFSNDKNSVFYSDSANIYQINIDGSNKKTVFTGSSNSGATIIGQVDNTLYGYYYNSSGANIIIKIDLSTDNATTLETVTSSMSNSITLSQSQIYYLRNSDGVENLYSLNLSNGTSTQVTNSINVLYVGSVGGLVGFIGAPTGGGANSLYVLGPGNTVDKSQVSASGF